MDTKLHETFSLPPLPERATCRKCLGHMIWNDELARFIHEVSSECRGWPNRLVVLEAPIARG